MILAEVFAKAMVAGDRDGAGALDVVCVREVAERDLSNKSTIACKCVSDA